MTTLETKKKSAAETGKKLHASLKLACSKKYTTTHYYKICRPMCQCENCVIMSPTMTKEGSASEISCITNLG